MSTIFISFIILLLIFFAMSIGVIFGRKPIAGSCGGLKTIGEIGDCEICGDPIPVNRLDALPYTTSCMDCANLKEA